MALLLYTTDQVLADKAANIEVKEMLKNEDFDWENDNIIKIDSVTCQPTDIETKDHKTDEVKTYLECLEVEDISPPLCHEENTYMDTVSIATSVTYCNKDFQNASSVTKLNCVTDLSRLRNHENSLEPFNAMVNPGESFSGYIETGTCETNLSEIKEDDEGSIRIVESGSTNLSSGVKCSHFKTGISEIRDYKSSPANMALKENQNVVSSVEKDEKRDSCVTVKNNEPLGRNVESKTTLTEKKKCQNSVSLFVMNLNDEHSECQKEQMAGLNIGKTQETFNQLSSCVVKLERLENDNKWSLTGPDIVKKPDPDHMESLKRVKDDKLNQESCHFSQNADNSDDEQSGVDGSDNVDEDLFDTIPVFLQTVQEVKSFASTSDGVSRLCQSLGSNRDLSETSKSCVQLQEEKKPSLRSRFSLDDLLKDKEESMSEEQRRIDKIHSDCKKDIEEGGFITILDRVEEEATEELALPEENQQILNQLSVEESQISEDRPGCPVFDPALYCCQFDECLQPTHCGFRVGGGRFIEKYLVSLQLGQYERVLTTNIIQIAFDKIQCKEELLRWLFFLMSVHPDYLLRQGCGKILMDVLHAEQLKGKQKWSPSVADILTVFVNYGATLDTMNIYRDGVQVEVYSQPNYTSPVRSACHQGYQIDNLLLVLKVLAYSLIDKSDKYNNSDLTLLLTVLMTVSLDTKLESFCAFDAFHLCVHTVLHQFSETDWNAKKISICRRISQISRHHHDKVVIAKLLPLDSRGTYLQRRTSFLMLEDLCSAGGRLSDEDLDKFPIRNLNQFVGYLKDMVHTDPYRLSSVISLMDFSVGSNSCLTATEREELHTLTNLLKRVTGEVRDNVRVLDRTRVKDMMFRVANRWSLDIQATKGKQSKIFEFVRQESPQQIEIETVQTVQTNEESEDTDSEIESESDQDELPCKMPKLEPFCVSPTLGNLLDTDENSKTTENDLFQLVTEKNTTVALKPETYNDNDIPICEKSKAEACSLCTDTDTFHSIKSKSEKKIAFRDSDSHNTQSIPFDNYTDMPFYEKSFRDKSPRDGNKGTFSCEKPDSVRPYALLAGGSTGSAQPTLAIESDISHDRPYTETLPSTFAAVADLDKHVLFDNKPESSGTSASVSTVDFDDLPEL